MAHRATSPAPEDQANRVLDGGFWLVLAAAGAFVVLVILSVLRGPPTHSGMAVTTTASGSPSPAASIDVSAYLARVPIAAPPIALTDQDGRSFSLTFRRGSPTFVFFGYTHCPDVCPATIGTIGKAMEATDLGARAVFVTVDPERDTATWLKEYVSSLRSGFTALTGSDANIRSTADAWGVRYQRVETGTPDGYSMSHTADVYLVDGGGTLRATFPFGTGPDAMAAVLREVAATTATAAGSPTVAPATPPSAPTSTPIATTSPSGAAALDVVVVSSSVWSGPPSPLILSLSAGGVRLNDTALHPLVQLVSASGEPVGSPVGAVPVQPPGVAAVSYVATIAIPGPGSWHLAVTAQVGSRDATGTAEVTALDPGTTAPLGAPAPTAHTPTLADVSGLARAITTDPAPDLRLSQRSTTDALADHQPFVLVVDSTKFRVSPACGRAIILARYLLDRWPQVGFIHLEPYRYSVITSTPVLDGSLADPSLTDPAVAWGIGGEPWGPQSMPWIFVVDGSGVVRAKYQGVVGSDDVDTIVALIAQGG